MGLLLCLASDEGKTFSTIALESGAADVGRRIASAVRRFPNEKNSIFFLTARC
jgi:hypothetical protein